MQRDRSEAVRTAIQRLAGLYEFGALQADTDPAAFLNRVADELTRLRTTCAPSQPRGDHNSSTEET